MKCIKQLVVISSLLFMVGCASGLNSMQQREYAAYENAGVLVVETDPSTAAWMGLLPGGGSFYNGDIGLGVVNLLTWPLSIAWDPISGRNGAMTDNYDVTKFQIKKTLEEEIGKLDDKLTLGEINTNQYVVAKRKIDQKYAY